MDTEDTLVDTMIGTMQTLERMAKALTMLGTKHKTLGRPFSVSATKLDEARLWISEGLAIYAIEEAAKADAVNPVQRD